MASRLGALDLGPNEIAAFDIGGIGEHEHEHEGVIFSRG